MSTSAASRVEERTGWSGHWPKAMTDDRARRRLLAAASAVGWGFVIAAAVLLIAHDGGYGYDAFAYWQAGRNVLDGNPLYWAHNEGALGAYRYPPLFAQIWAPFALLPPLAFSWAWRAVCLLALRYLAGSWRNVGLWCLVPFTWTELSVANVTFPTAALTMMALRGRAEVAAWAGAFKFAPLLALPYLWLRRPQVRRGLFIGAATLLAACALSYVLSPASWWLYVQALGQMSTSRTTSFGVVALLPNGFQDALLRGAIAIFLTSLAVWRGSDRLAFTATIVAVPVVTPWALVPLLALPRIGEKQPATPLRGPKVLPPPGRMA